MQTATLSGARMNYYTDDWFVCNKFIIILCICWNSFDCVYGSHCLLLNHTHVWQVSHVDKLLRIARKFGYYYCVIPSAFRFDS